MLPFPPLSEVAQEIELPVGFAQWLHDGFLTFKHSCPYHCLGEHFLAAFHGESFCRDDLEGVFHVLEYSLGDERVLYFLNKFF